MVPIYTLIYVMTRYEIFHRNLTFLLIYQFLLLLTGYKTRVVVLMFDQGLFCDYSLGMSEFDLISL